MKQIGVMLLALIPAILWAQEETPVEEPKEKPNQRVFGKSDESSYAGKVVVVEIGQNDLINGQSFKFMRRTLRRADEEGAKAIVFTLDTPGGNAIETKNLMREMAETKTPLFVFIDPEAGSAGALISVAASEIYMAPSSLVGAAALVDGTGREIEDYMRKKLESFFAAHVRAIVGKRGHNVEVLEAMMFASDEEKTFGTVTVGKGEILTLHAEEAAQVVDGKPLFAKAVVTSIDELLEKEGFGDIPIVTANQTGFERIAWWVKYLSPVLILVGVGAAYVEMKAPGFGIGGVISLTAFAIFFFGNYIAGNLAGYELAAVFVLGIVLVLIEVFVIPGTGVAGILGGVLIFGALLTGMIDEIEFEDFSNEGFTSGGFLELLGWPALSLSLGLLGGMFLVVLAMRFLSSVPGVNWLTLAEQLADGTGAETVENAKEEHRVGWTGTATTDLRPSGKADFKGQLLDVVAEGAFISKGETVRIVEEDGMRIAVRQV